MKKILAVLCMTLVSLWGVAGNAMAAVTCPAGSVRAGEVVSSIAECNIAASNGTQDLTGTAINVINRIIGLIAIIAVVVMIVGGIYFMLSQGDSAKVTRAKNTILYGLIGLGVSILSFAIVNFVLKLF